MTAGIRLSFADNGRTCLTVMKPRQPRSCGGTPEPCRRPMYTSRRPRVGTATDHDQGLVTVAVVKGPSGFGFTLAESDHGQVIKDVVDTERCRNVFTGDVLVAINDVTVRHWSHDDVVNLLRRCRARRVTRLTLMTSHARQEATVGRPTTVPARPMSAMASPLTVDGQDEPLPRVDYNQLYRRMYSPVPFVHAKTPQTIQTKSPDVRRSAQHDAAASTPNGESDIVPTSRYSAPPTVDIAGTSATTRRRTEPRRSLPAQPVTAVDLLSPIASRRTSRESSQAGLNFSGTPDFIPASTYLEDDDRRRRATGRPTADELASLTLDEVFISSATNTPLLPAHHRDESFHSCETDDASLPSSGSLRSGAAAGLPVTSPTFSGSHDRRTPVGFVGAGNESCNGYNARTATLHSAAQLRHHPAAEHRYRGQSAVADVLGPDRRPPQRRPDATLSNGGDLEQEMAAMTSKNESRDQRVTKDSVASSRSPELRENGSESLSPNGISSSADLDGGSADVVRSNTRHHPNSSSSSAAAALYKVELHRGSRGFGFAIRGGREFAGMPICVLNIASGGSADVDGRLRDEDEIVSINGILSEGMTHSDAVHLIHNSSSPLVLLMRQTTHDQSSDLPPLKHTTAGGRVPRRYTRSPMIHARQTSSPTRHAAVSTPPIHRRPTPTS